MKVTPEGIREYTFSKSFRGYDKEAVDQYLMSLSQEWEKEEEEIASLKKQLETSEKELNRLKEVESVMLRTIKEGDENARKLIANAEINAAEILAEATKNGDVYFAKMKTDGDDYWAKAENKGIEIIETSENERENLLNTANETIEQLKAEAKKDLEASEKEYNSLDIAKQQLLYDLNSLLTNTTDRLINIQTKYSPEIFDAKKVGIDNIPTAVIEARQKKEVKIVPKPAAKIIEPKKVKISKKEVEKPVKKVVKAVKVEKIKAEVEPEDDGLPTVQKILAMTEAETANLPPEETNIEENQNKSFFDTI